MNYIQKCLLLLSVVLIIIVYFININKKNNQNNEGFIESLDIGYPGMKNHYGYYQSNIYKHNKLHNIGGVMDNNMINKVSDNENKVIKKEERDLEPAPNIHFIIINFLLESKQILNCIQLVFLI